MKPMLPTENKPVVSLADIVPSCFRALTWTAHDDVLALRPTHSVVVVLVDGLGTHNIKKASGYLRFISQELDDSITARTVFPSTTASALSSFVTGRTPGSHGILGYQTWNPGRNEFVNQLSGVSAKDVESGWLASPSLLSESAQRGLPVTVVAHPRFASSSLTKMLYGSATYMGESSFEKRFDVVVDKLSRGEDGFYFVYVSDLDEAAHAYGVLSQQWLAQAELLDSSMRKFVKQVSGLSSIILTADHGVIDSLPERHVNFGSSADWRGVRAIGGEPRCLQLKLRADADSVAVSQHWARMYGNYAEVLSSADVASRYGSDIEASYAERAPEIYVVAKEDYAFYDISEPLAPSRKMVGQHGGVSPEEVDIPLLIWQ